MISLLVSFSTIHYQGKIMSKLIIATDKETLETIAATFPTQKELIAATSVYYNTTSPLGDVEKEKEVSSITLVVTSKDTNYHLTNEALMAILSNWHLTKRQINHTR